MNCLDKSIDEKWIPIVEGRHAPVGSGDCACCDEYCELECKGCPISTDTGREYCRGTPEIIFAELYDKLWDKYGVWRIDASYDLMFDLKAAAQMMIDYLIDLRRRNETHRKRT